MRIERYGLGALQTNCYLVSNEQIKEMLLVDPGDSPDVFMQHLEQLKEEGYTLKAILLTHGHFDHILGVKRITETYHIPVYALKEELPLLADPRLNLSRDFMGHAVQLTEVQPLEDEQHITLIGYDFQVIATPGHTVGGCCYYVASEEVVFSGDTLFARSIGRSDFETGDMFALIRSLKSRLALLPDDTMVYPGHNELTSIGTEKKLNPYFK